MFSSWAISLAHFRFFPSSLIKSWFCFKVSMWLPYEVSFAFLQKEPLSALSCLKRIDEKDLLVFVSSLHVDSGGLGFEVLWLWKFFFHFFRIHNYAFIELTVVPDTSSFLVLILICVECLERWLLSTTLLVLLIRFSPIREFYFLSTHLYFSSLRWQHN